MNPLKQRKHILIGLLFLINNLIFISGTAQTGPQPHTDYIQFFNGAQIERCHDTRNRNLYHALAIYLEEDTKMSFEEITKNQHLFQKNNTHGNFDRHQTYWIKIDVQARKDQQDSILFFMQDFTSLQGWDYVDAYLIHQDSSIDYQRTGFSVPKSQRTIDFPLTPVVFGLLPNERATIFFRLENCRQTIESHFFKNRSEGLYKHLFLDVQIKNLSEYLSPYQFDGNYYSRSAAKVHISK